MSLPMYTEHTYTGDGADLRSEWLEMRTHGIGGSDAGAVLGVNPWRSPLSLWLEKTGREQPNDISGKPAVEWGTRLEKEIREKFAENHPELTVSIADATYISRERPWAFANVDGVLTDSDGKRGVLEIKTAGLYSEKDWSDGVPLHYQAQVAHYLGVTGWSYAFVAVLIGGQDYREYFIERDESDVQAVADAVDDFWLNYVERDQMPALVGARDEKAALAVAHAGKPSEMAEVHASEWPEIAELIDVRAQIAALTEKKDALETSIMARIGDKKGVLTETERVVWVRQNRRSFKQREFKAAYPELFEQFSAEIPGNGGLRISERRD